MKLALALLLPLAAQPALDLSGKICPGTQTRILAAIPATVTGGAQVLVPVCLALGSGLRLNMDAAGGPAIEATGQALREVAERIRMDLIPLDQNTLTFSLVNTPAKDTLVKAYYRGGSWWTSQLDVVPAAGKMVSLALPAGRILNTGDVVVLTYWTAEPAAPSPAAPPPAATRVTP